MKKLLFAIVLCLSIGAIGSRLYSQDREIKPLIDSLTMLDENIRNYFPRWKICEPDLQMQVYQAFLLNGFDKKELNMQDIQVLAVPPGIGDKAGVYELLTITCGTSSMNSVELDANMAKLSEVICGRISYSSGARDGGREYCYQDIPPELPVTGDEASAIINYLEPTNVKHAITLSLFEQSLKIGSTGFWVQSKIGTDENGYPFWYSGESKLLLRRPLYANHNPKTLDRIPYLIDIYLGGAYRITSGLEDKNSALSWVTGRQLNIAPGGKLVAGIDFHMPFHPQFGIHANLEIPLKPIQDENVDINSFRTLTKPDYVDFNPGDPRYGIYTINTLVPVLRATGQATFFYNWWLNPAKPENFFRFDLGLNYFEVREYASYLDKFNSNIITATGVDGVHVYKPNELGDWIFAKAEFRSQSTWPFGLSLQYANQILLGDVWVPLIGNWFYIEGKYSTPLRGLRSYEVNNFFMISPLLRITI